MNDEWLAAWDSASEEDRRLVLAKVGGRVEAACRAIHLDHIDGPHTFVIAARRTGDALVVATCSHYRVCLRDATQGIPVSPTDYHYVHVEIDEVSVEAGAVTEHELLLARENFHVEPDEPIDDRPEAREVADEFLLGYPATAHVTTKVRAECEEAGLGSWIARPPRIRLLCVVVDGSRVLVTTVASYIIFHSSQSEEWGVQYLTIDEVTTENGAVVSETRPLQRTIDLPHLDLDRYDADAPEQQLVSDHLSTCKDWRIVWHATDAGLRSLAVNRASSIITSQCAAAGISESWRDPKPDVVAARRDGDRLIIELGWNRWNERKQSIGIAEVAIEKGSVVRQRALSSATFDIPDRSDPMQTYRDELPALRDRAAAVAYVDARLRRNLDSAGYLIREPTVTVVRVQGREFSTVGWYRLGFQEQVGRDRIQRVIEADALTILFGVVVKARPLVRTMGEMDEVEPEADRLDREHVAEITRYVREGRYG